MSSPQPNLKGAVFRWSESMSPKMTVWKMTFLFKQVIFRFHLIFQGVLETWLWHIRPKHTFTVMSHESCNCYSPCYVTMKACKSLSNASFRWLFSTCECETQAMILSRWLGQAFDSQTKGMCFLDIPSDTSPADVSTPTACRSCLKPFRAFQ